MDFWSAIVLGVIQGITEFLPVSSSSHLLLLREFFSFGDENSLAFDAILHLATTLAIIVYFWNDIWVLVQAAIRKLGRLPVNDKDIILLQALLAGTVPAVLIGLTLGSVMENLFRGNLAIIGIGLFLGSLFFMYAEWRYFVRPPHGVLLPKTGFYIGLFQGLAFLIPGLSRLGSTLAGGMLLGMSRIEAAKFSFLLAIPITLGVGTKKLLELIVTKGEVAWLPIFVGAIVCFFIALIFLHLFLTFIKRYSLWPFIWYRLLLAVLIAYYIIYI
jgi:undecaprenyl-diphosphatase